MAKVLRVCNSEFLPPLSERDPNYVYFVYDKMAVYLGQNYYSDPFCVVEEMPKHPVEGMLYITIEGKLMTYIDYNAIEIGEIEDQAQIKYLYDAGTVYFMKAEYRYLDAQTRTIQLPYQNGSYQLSVNLAKNIIIDKNTVIRYNPETGRFEIDGRMYGETVNKSDMIGDLKGSETESTFTNIINGHIRVDLKISQEAGNLIQLLDSGVYASIDEYLTDEELEKLRTSLDLYKASLNKYLAELKAVVDAADISVSEDALIMRIKNELDKYHPNITKILDHYEEVYNHLLKLREDSKEYTDKRFLETREAISKYIDDELRKMHPWEDYHAYLLVKSGAYKNYSYGGSFCKLYQASDTGARFVYDTELMNEIYVVNKGSKPAWVRLHLAVLADILPNPKDPADPENMVIIGATAASLATGGWNWSTSMNRDPGKYFGPGGQMNIYRATINDNKYVVYVITYETTLATNTKSLSAIRTMKLNTNDDIEVGQINGIIQTDQWEFPVVIESAAASLGTDPYEVFDMLYGSVGTYNPFNMDERVDEYEPSVGGDDIYIEYSIVAHKPTICGVELSLGTSLKDIGIVNMSAQYAIDVFNGNIPTVSHVETSSADTVEGDPSEYDYLNFANKPMINGVRLNSDKSYTDLGINYITADRALAIMRGTVTPQEDDLESDTNPGDNSGNSIFNYKNIKNKPSINGISLVGNRSLKELGFRYMTEVDVLKIMRGVS